MKRIFLSLSLLLAISIVAVSCKKKADEAKTTEATEVAEATAASAKYSAVPSESSIEWKGFKPTGTHNGTIALSNGVLTVNDGNIESGTFMIDMSTITVKDIPADNEMNGKLTGHLKSADFFDIEKYPTSVFTVTNFETKDGKSMLSGNLSMKDAKNEITFPVNVSMDGDMMTLTSETFTIDRSKWNVKYGSKSFFDDLGDKFINDEFELKITLKAKKQADAS